METTENLIANLETSIATKQKEIRACHAEIHKLSVTSRDPEAEKAARKLAKADKYKTTNSLTVENLKKAGNKVKVVHIRYVQVEKIPVLIPVPSYMRKVVDFTPTGGTTHVIIETATEERIVTTSICHEHDSFDYKLGTKLALEHISQERADHLLEVATLVTSVSGNALAI